MPLLRLVGVERPVETLHKVVHRSARRCKVAWHGRVYYNGSGGTIGESEVTGLSMSHMGQTRDGYGIHHFTFHRNNRRMSYDAVRINDEYHYILGSGH